MQKKDLKIVFMGTPEIAVASLDAIVKAGYQVTGVITAPDRPAGRGRKIQYSDVKKYALENGLKLLQPANLKDPGFIKELRLLGAHVQVVVAFRMLPEAVWAMPSEGTFNLHASLLPQYRGAAPINWAVINGETQTGVTTFFLDKEIDTGRIIDQKKVDIDPRDTAGSLHDKLKDAGAELVVETLDKIAENRIETIEQSKLFNYENELKKAPKIFKEDCRINWEHAAGKIADFIRGMNPVPGAFTELNTEKGENFMIKIFEAEPVTEKHDFHPGKLFTDNKNFIKISTSDGYIDIKEIQAAGKKRMKTQDFLRGYDF